MEDQNLNVVIKLTKKNILRDMYTTPSDDMFQKAELSYLRSCFKFCAIRKYFLALNAIL